MLQHFLKAHPGDDYSLKQIFRSLKLTTQTARMLCVDCLNELMESGDIARNDNGGFSSAQSSHICEGVFARTNGGRNFVDLPDGTGIVIYNEDTYHALPGDRVRVSLFAKQRSSRQLHGQIIEIVQRNEKPVIGTIQISRNAAFLISYNNALPNDILIPPEKLRGARDGDKVCVRVTDWPERARNPIGEVVDVLGESGNNDTEMHAILAEFGLPYKYPGEVEAAAEQIDPGITPAEIARREDMRAVTTFTIDPRDAKDFDDALSIRRLREGVWEVGVHIADVSHYVAEDSVIDREARQRATSVYLVDRTVPMLPERLCNFVCSLRPNEEKLAYSVVFEMSEEAEVLRYRIAHTVIRSDRRFVYEEVQHLLERLGEASAEDMRAPTPPFAPLPADVPPRPAEDFKDELVALNRMAHTLRERRMRNGAIDFDHEEVRFDIDENGKPTGVYFKRAKDANKLVEEFMLLANRTVAESVGKAKDGKGKAKTLPYRIHDVPDPNKLDRLGQFVARFGYLLRTQGSKKDIAQSINGMLSDVQGKPIQDLVETVALRAMMKARYSTVNIGHYGLAFDYYTHFTSPIRRYPDLMVHRLLTRYAEGAKSASQSKYEELCDHSSAMELLATQAERASIKYKQVEFMEDKIGEEYDAKVTGVTDIGIYAEIDQYKCEGLVAVRFLGDEAFDFDDRNYCLVGRKSHQRFALGDKVRIRVARANLYRKQLDFDLVRKLSSADPTAERKPVNYLQPNTAKQGDGRTGGGRRKTHRGRRGGKGRRR